MAQHRLSEPLRSPLARALMVAATIAAAVGLSVGGAAAQPKVAPNGFLTLTVDAAATALPPGQAAKAAKAACVGRAAAAPPVAPAVTPVVVAPADLTVDAVRLAFPNPVAVCAGVTLQSQVAADAAA